MDEGFCYCAGKGWPEVFEAQKGCFGDEFNMLDCREGLIEYEAKVALRMWVVTVDLMRVLGSMAMVSVLSHLSFRNLA